MYPLKGEAGSLMNQKIIVTHIFPDLDAISSVWLLKRFDPSFEEAEVKFVPAGLTYKNQEVDSDPSVIHTDTGMGRFDHHHTDERTCAAELVFNYLKQRKLITLKHQSAVSRLVELVIQIDHFEDFFWPNSAEDRYELNINHVLNHLKLSGKMNDEEIVEEGRKLLDAVLFGLRQKIKTEEEIKKGVEFKSKWGKSIGIETQMSRVSKLAQKIGFNLVIRKEPETNFVSIKCQPKKSLDLTKAYNDLKKADKNADWFFHKSKHIILNGSRHNPKVKPSTLNLEEIISIIKKIK